jgi:tetratricopeptide (TPR) repeat protein
VPAGEEIMHDPWTDKLSDYLDDDLPDEEREATAAHLAQCTECAQTLAELRQVVEAARVLPSRPPARDLWNGIADRAANSAGRRVRSIAAFRAAPARRFSFTLPQLAAASLLLAAASGALTWTLRDAMNPRLHPAVINEQTAAASATTMTGDLSIVAPAPVATVSFADAQYDAAVSDLEKALAKGRKRLDPATVAIVQQNLQIIDGAIAQARQALDSDPANSYLSSHLVETRRKKLDLLRQAAALTN